MAPTTTSGAACTQCDALVEVTDGYLDFLSLADPAMLNDVETDYDAGPTLACATPLVHAAWRALAAQGERVARAGLPLPGRAVWVGGGGNNRVGVALAGDLAVSVVVDTSPVQLRTTPLLGTETVLLRALAEDVPVIDGWADLTELQSVLDHVTDPMRAVAEAARVTAPGGRVIVTLTNDGSWYRRVAERLGSRAHLARDTHAHRFSPTEVRGLLDRARLLELTTASVSFVRLPAPADRWLGRVLGPAALDRVLGATDWVLRALFGDDAGGMMVVTGRVAGVSDVEPNRG
jgi:SAM-dependent methyltransferase